MEHVHVNGAQVPAIGLGTWQVEGSDCYEAVTHALALGYRHVDTAQMYGNEADVGRGLADAAVDRSDVWLTTKLALDAMAHDAVRPALESSLRRLGTDYVDLLLIHWPVADVPLADTLGAMRAAVDDGLVAHIGVSNFPSAHVRQAIELAPILTNQVEYHPYLAQDAVLTEAERDGHMVTAYSPLAKGRIARDPTVAEIAEGHGKTPAQVALRWLIAQPRVSAIPRSSRAERRAENLDVFDFELSDEEMKALSGLARPDGRLIDPPFAPDWD